MLQRIQSVYLFLITVLTTVALFLTMGRFVTDGVLRAELYNLSLKMADGTVSYSPWAMFALLLLVAVASLVCIFLFRKRKLQMRITIFSGLLLVGYYVAFIAFVLMLKEHLGDFNVGFGAALPAVALILDYLAFRAIMKDELIVQSLDRLR